jgi:hypothetical protein
MKTAAKPGKTPFEALDRAGLAYVRFGLDHHEEVDVMFSIIISEEHHPKAKAAAVAAFDFLVRLLEECKKAGLLPHHDPLTAARIAWAHVHGITALAAHGQVGFKTRAEVLDFAAVSAAALRDGLAGSPEKA